MNTVRKAYADQDHKIIDDYIKDLSATGKRKLNFILPQVVKATDTQREKKNISNCLWFYEEHGHNKLIARLDDFVGDDNFVIKSATVLQNVLKELPFNEVKLNFINAGMAKTCLKFLNRTDSSEEARDIMLDILIHLTLCWPGHKKMYQDGVYDFVEEKIRNIMKKGDLKNKKKNEIKDDLKYIESACNLATDVDLAPELIESGLIDNILDMFESDNYPDIVYRQCIMPIATFSKTEEGRTYLKKRGFDLKKFVLKFDKMDDEKIHKAGVTTVKNLATEADLDIALKGLEDMNEDDITFISYLALCDNLIPIMVKKDIIKKILDTLNKLLERKAHGEKVNERSIRNLSKVLTTICKKDNSCIDRFLQLDGFQTVSKLLDLKNTEINTGLLPFISLVTEKGPATVVPTMVQKEIPKKLALFWEETPPLVQEMRDSYKNIRDFKTKVVETNDPTSAKQKEALEKYKMMREIMESGFYVFNKLSEKDPTIFDGVSPKFHYASACHLKEFTESKTGQNEGLQFMGRQNYTDEDARELIKGDFVDTTFNVKLNNTNWHKYGLNCERVLLKMCNSNPGIINKLKDNQAYKTVVASLHFLHDDDDEDEGNVPSGDDDDEADLLDDDDDDSIKLESKEDWTHVNKKQEKEIVEKGHELLDLLLESYTLSQVNSNLQEQLKKIVVKPRGSDIPQIRIELATLAVMNSVPKFGMDSLQKDKFAQAFAMTKKIADCKNFEDKDKVLADGLKCFTSYIGITNTKEGFESYDEKKIGDQYFDFNNKILKKNKDANIAKVFLREMANGLETRYNIIHDAKPDIKPKLTRGDSILGTRGITPGDRVDVAAVNIIKMMKSFPDNDKIQYFGAKALTYLARTSPSARADLNKNNVSEQLNAALNMPLSLNTHKMVTDALDALAQNDDNIITQFSKQNCMSNLMTTLAQHDGDPVLLEKAKPLIAKLSKKPEEVGKLKSQLEIHMQAMKTYGDKFDTATPEEIKKGESSNALCGILMAVPDLAVEGVNKGMLDILKKLWEKKNPISKKVKEKKITGKKKDKHLKSVDGLCNNLEFILQNTDWDPRIADETSKNSIFDAVWRSYENVMDFEHQAAKHAKILNLALKDDKIANKMIKSAEANDGADTINFVLENFKDVPEVMNEAIPLAQKLCEKSPKILAKKINTASLIPILVNEGNRLLEEMLDDNMDDAVLMKKLNNNLGILESFSNSPENLKIMDYVGGLDYLNKVKRKCAEILPKLLDADLNNLSKRSSILASKADTDGTLQTPKEFTEVKDLLEASKHVCTILKNWDDSTDVIDQIKDDFYTLMAYNMDDPLSVAPQVAILKKNLDKNPGDIKLIPMEQGFNILSAIKHKYYDPKNQRKTPEDIRKGQISDDVSLLLEKFDLSNVLEQSVKKFGKATLELDEPGNIDHAIADLKKINDFLDNPKIKNADIQKQRAAIMDGMNFLFSSEAKHNPQLWHQIIDNLNKLNKRDPKFMDELAKTDFADKMFANILDDMSILNDPANEDIMEDLLKYQDAYAEDEILRTELKGPTIYQGETKDLKVGRILPNNEEVEDFAPLENDGKPLSTLLEMVTYDDKKGDFARKVLLDSVPEPEVAKTLLQNSGFKSLSDAKIAIKAVTIKDMPQIRKDEILDDLEKIERVLFHYIPDTKKESEIYSDDIDADDWIVKIKKEITELKLPTKNPKDAQKALELLTNDLDILNILTISTHDSQPFIKHNIAQTILQKIDELAKLGSDVISKNPEIAQAIGDLNESLYGLLKDPLILQNAITNENGVPIEKNCLKETIQSCRKKGNTDMDPKSLKNKIKHSENYTLSEDPYDKAVEATLQVQNLMLPKKSTCNDLKLKFEPTGHDFGATPQKGEKELPETLFGELRDVLVCKVDNPQNVQIAAEILNRMFDATPHEDFQDKKPLLKEMLAEAKKVKIAHSHNDPLDAYIKKIQNKITDLDKADVPQFLDNIARFIGKKANDWDPLFGHEEDLKDMSFLAAWFKKLVDMAQDKPLEPKWDACLVRILDAIEKCPKTKDVYFQMLNLDMHKTGILGGMTTNLDDKKMNECLHVTDNISRGEGIIPKMKKDKTNVAELMKLVTKLKTAKLKELNDPNSFARKEMIDTLDLIVRLTDADEAALLFGSDVSNIQQLTDALKSLKHISPIVKHILDIMQNLTISEGNLENCFKGKMGDAVVDIAQDEIEDSLEDLQKMTRITGDLSKNAELQKQFGEQNVIEWLEDTVKKYPKDPVLVTNGAWASKYLNKDSYQPNVKQSLDSRTFPLICNYIAVEPENTNASNFACDSIIECIKETPENRKRLAELKIGPKIVKVLSYYAKPENFDNQLVFKCIFILGMITAEGKNNLGLASEGLVDSLATTQESCNYGENLTDKALTILIDLNKKFDPAVLTQTINDGAVQMLANVIKAASKNNDVPLFMKSVDVISKLALTNGICKFIGNFDIIDFLLRFLKEHQENPEICQKITDCLRKLSSDDSVKAKIIDKDGHALILDTMKKNWEKGETSLSCLEQLNKLADFKDPEHLHDLFDGGCPQGVIAKYEIPDNDAGLEEVNNDHVIESQKLMNKMCDYHQALDQIGASFAKNMFDTMNEKLDKENIQIESANLCRNLLNDPQQIDRLYHAGGVPTLKAVIEKWSDNEAIAVKDLESLLILLKASNDCVEQGRSLKMDDLMLKLVKNSKIDAVKKIAQDCHELLKEVIVVPPPVIPPPKVEEKEPDFVAPVHDCHAPGPHFARNTEPQKPNPVTEMKKKRKRQRKTAPAFNLDDIEARMTMEGHDEEDTFEIPASAKNWLLAGKIITVINEEFQKKKLHFFLTRDMVTFVCKEPKKAKVLQDFACKVNKIYDVTLGYNKNNSKSPFVKATGFFERKPDPNLCFSIIGPVNRHGRANLNFICDTSLEASKWVEYIELVRAQDKRDRQMRLTK